MADTDTHDVLTTDQRFAIVPEWVIDARISDCAFRLYAVLLRYGQTSGQRMPSRQSLARRLHKGSTDTVDRAMKELVTLGAVQVERRRRGQQNLTNRYHLRTIAPTRRGHGEGPGEGGRRNAATSDSAPSAQHPRAGGRRDAATPGPESAATPSRTDAATVAAAMRPNPEHLTQNNPPPAPPPTTTRSRRTTGREEETSIRQQFLAECGVTDLEELARRCATLRQQHRLPTGRWSAECLHAALHVAVRTRGWPAKNAVPALLEIAADPTTRSPMRLAEAGPWWDTVASSTEPTLAADADDLAEKEKRLDALDGRRLALQREARRQLSAERMPLTRATVALRACQLLDKGWLEHRADKRLAEPA